MKKIVIIGATSGIGRATAVRFHRLGYEVVGLGRREGLLASLKEELGEGFSYDVDVDNGTEYRIIYEIDMKKINDNDLAAFNIGRDFSTFQESYEDLGYTCE